MQHVHALAATLGVTTLPEFLLAMARAEGDAEASLAQQPDGSVTLTRRSLPLFRGIDATPAMLMAWQALMCGAVAAWDRFARLEALGPMAWRISVDR